MPSASAKLEKQASTEALDPLKQILTTVEKKVRNLEKRKAKLDTYKSESNSGKELNDDQKNAIKKYDQVVEILEFAKELQKSFGTIAQENFKLQKKAAKREMAEKQQQDIQRIKELLLIQDILTNMGSENVRSDFLGGINGALKLSEDDLSHFDELYKLVSPERDSESSELFDDQLSSSAEHLSSLLDGKNKEFLGTTYKNLKETIIRIHESGYFGYPGEKEIAQNLEMEESSIEDRQKKEVREDFTEEEDYDLSSRVGEIQSSEQIQIEEVHAIQSAAEISQMERPYYPVDNTTDANLQYNRSLQEVLPVQGNFNFLQESQIDLESPHMDPAVVVAHPIVSPAMGYPTSQYPPSSQSTTSNHGVPQLTQRPGVQGGERNLGGTPTNSTMQQQLSSTSLQLSQNQVNPQPDFDPSRPIPTQTFTNQSFAAAIHPMMAAAAVVPPSYVPVTISHSNLPPQHMITVSMMAQPVSPSGTSTPPQHVSGNVSPLHTVSMMNQGVVIPSDNSGVQPVSLSQQENEEQYSNVEFKMNQISLESKGAQSSVVDSFQPINDSQSYKSYSTENQGGSFTEIRSNYGNNRGTRGSRSRGSSNGYSRGGSTRGSFGNNRAPRGSSSGRGGSTRGRSNYRNQQ